VQTWVTRDELAAGRTSCPMDYPRPEYSEYAYFVQKLSVSSLYLERNQTYLGHCVLIYDPAPVTRIDQLSPEQWLALARDLRVAETAIYRAFRPDHMNVESLGNVMPHLHWHIVSRHKNDGRWGGPIWTTTSAEMRRKELGDSEYRALASRIRNAIEDDA